MATEQSALPFSYDDYAAIDDGRRYQVLDGELVMTPSPSFRHQHLVLRLSSWLYAYAETSKAGMVCVAPLDVVLAAPRPATVLQPDMLFIAKERYGIITKPNIQGPPDLVVEVLSPSTARIDTVRKHALYARFGVPEVWYVLNDADQVEVVTLPPGASQYGRPALYVPGDVLRSERLPGFELQVEALFAGLELTDG